MPTAVRVALPVPLPTLFDYLPPAGGKLVAGQRVLVPFGRGKQVGIVVDAAATPALDASRLKPILQPLDDEPLLDGELLRTLTWAADYWLGAPGEAFAQALPLALREPRPLPDIDEEYWQLTPAGSHEHLGGRRRGGSKALLDLLIDGPRHADELAAMLPDWRSAARRLAAAGLIARCAAPDRPAGEPAPAPIPLSAEQSDAVAAIGATFGRFQPFLLDGITGSGKTEVYLALIEQALAEGRQSLLLVPEIGLAPQTLRRLRERLGVPIELLHSNLAEGERARSWLRARSGEARVVLGTRSAVFTPLPNAGLILVDEEHDASYKQQEGFRYHARDLALVRARELGVPIVLGSATPSLETLANVASGRFRALRLRSRPGASRPAPQVQIVDVRAQYLDHGLSPTLLEAVREAVARGEQALVFRNRRGYAPVLLCHACGWHADCPRCEHPMTLHAGQRQLRCHHCDRRAPVPSHCPACGAGALWPQGHGTERLEQALGVLFPDVPVRRIDRETTRRRDAFEHLLDELRHDGPAILVGTQMLAKGHDLPRLTLVAIVSVDEGLHSVDFRAGERLAQLLVQVAGRAGRADRPGRVLLQTHHPEHPLLRSLLASGYGTAAATLLAEREAAQLPPYSHQILLRADAHGRGEVDAFLAAAAAALPIDPEVQLAGPMPAPMPLRAGRHRGQLLLESTSRARLHTVVRPWRLQLGALPLSRRVRWSLDVDPIDLY